MKKIIFTALVSIFVATNAFSGEEIQLAAAIGSTGPTAASPGTSDVAKPSSEGTKTTTAATGTSTTTMVVLGVIGAGVIAAVAGGGSSSTSSH